MADQEIAVVLRLLASHFNSEIKKSGGLMGEFGKLLGDWRVQATAIGSALFAIAKSTANYGEELLKSSQQVGVSVEALAALRHAATLSEVSNEELGIGLRRLSTNAFDMARGVDQAEQAFDLLHVTVKTAEGTLRPTEELLLELADRFRAMEDGTAKTALAMQIFGRSGNELIPFLNQGKAGIQALMQEAKALGLVMSEQDARAADAFNDELTRLQGVARGLTNELGNMLIPALTRLAQTFLDLAQGEGTSAFASFLSNLVDAVTLRIKALQALGLTVKAIWQEIIATFKFSGDELAKENARIEREMSEGMKKLFTAKAPKPEVTTRDVNIGAPGPVITNLKEQLALYIGGLLLMAAERQRDFADEVKLAQAKLQVAESGQASLEVLAARRRGVFEAQMAQELAVADQTEAQRLAIVTKYTAQIEEQRRIETGGFLEGWRIGLNKYINDYGSMLGLAVDLSRRTAQLMEQAFRTFFFDLFEGRIKSFKDVLLSVLDFVKQVIALVLAQLATARLLGFLGWLSPIPFTPPSGGGGIRTQHGGRWTVQGPGGTDSQLVRFMASPGERVTVETPEQQGQSLRIGEPRIAITIKNEGVPVQGQIGSVDRDAEGWVVNVILRNITSNGPLRHAFGR